MDENKKHKYELTLFYSKIRLILMDKLALFLVTIRIIPAVILHSRSPKKFSSRRRVERLGLSSRVSSRACERPALVFIEFFPAVITCFLNRVSSQKF